MLAIGDALAFVACRRKDFSPRDFAALHPGGSLGRRLTAVRDLMRSGDQVRIASEQITVREVFVARGRGKAIGGEAGERFLGSSRRVKNTPTPNLSPQGGGGF